MGREELEIYLAAHSDETVIFFVGDCGVERIEEIFNYTMVKQCYIVCPWIKRDIGFLEEQIVNDAKEGLVYLPEKLVFMGVADFIGLKESWTLCLLNCKASNILAMLGLKPSKIIGTIVESEISAYRIWEIARGFCNHILIKTLRKNRSPIVLEWEKDFENPIELSVIFPVYNVASYLDKCIDSVTKWKADYVEYIFVSDGSKDESVDIIKEWMKNDSRIRLIEKENGGCASARQKGLEEARGRYIGFVDPDDFVDEEMFHRLLKTAMCGSYDISLCGYNEYYENTGKIKRAEDSLWYPYLDGCFDRNKIIELITFCRVAIWRGIYRKEFLLQNNIGFYTDIKRFDDLPFKVETFAYAKSVTMINEHLYYYRLEREGQDVAANDERLYVHFDIFKHLDESIGNTGNQRLIDNLQMCKIQTHRYALSKIQDKFVSEYKKRAKLDLLTLCDVRRTYSIAERMLGKNVADEFMNIVR